MRLWIPMFVTVSMVTGPAAGQDVAAGTRLFGQCRACHSVGSATSGVGPNLFGVVGRRAGFLPGYAYSPAMKTSGLIWTRDNLDRFLAQPRAVVKGTKMPFFGIANPSDRASLVAYLATLKSQPVRRTRKK